MNRHFQRCSAIVAAGALLLMAGCTVGPDFKTPDASVAKRWSESGGGTTASPAQTVEWWKVFGDPTMTRLVRQAAQQNLSVEQAGLKVAQSRAQLAIAVGNAFPQLQQASGNLSYNRDPSFEPSKFTAASAGFDASWEIDLWGKYRRGVESANATLLADVAGYHDALISVISETARTYVSIRAIESRLKTVKKNIEIQTETTRIAKALWDRGAKDELDYQQSAATLFSTRSQVPQLNISLKQSHHALAILLGLPPQKMDGLLEGETATIPAPPTTIATGIPADLLRRRPDIRQAEFQAASRSEQIGIAKTDLYPRLSLLGGFGWNASDAPGQSLGELFNSTTFSAGIGPSVTWNVLNYGRIRNNVRVQDAVFEQSLNNYRQQVLNAAGEVEDAMVGLESSRVQAGLLKQGVDASQRALDLAMLQYKEGDTDFQRVLDSTQALSQQQDQHIQTLGNISTNAIALYKALGGGWKNTGRKTLLTDETRNAMKQRTNWGKLLPDSQPPNEDTSGAAKAAP